jgi:hypothetical protein
MAGGLFVPLYMAAIFKTKGFRTIWRPHRFFANETIINIDPNRGLSMPRFPARC